MESAEKHRGGQKQPRAKASLLQQLIESFHREDYAP
jgi:hypothetical protein